ncbi:MAG: YhdH/YhfP family quinone oxidoreductase [Planctomycetia bacterium]|nr:YhdH/YhfP family quinone oxidoreductase [Planctomycetia bacterium]
MAADTFRCYLVTKDESGKAHAAVAQKTLADLPAGEVLIRVAYSSLNYKDGLSASGSVGVTRKYPHVPGIDAAGAVAESTAAEFRAGDEVLVTGYDLGQNTWGGFSEYVRVPAAWVVPLPAALSLRESMIYGTAGFTAAQSVAALAAHGIEPGQGEVLVTGASGGVGSLAVALLSKQGYRVTASSGKASAHDLLKLAGAAQIISRDEVNDQSGKPLLPTRYAGAVDTVGGNTLSTVVRSLARGGCVAACGLVGGTDLKLTVYPFLLRGVDLAGIDSAECPMATRRRLWQRLATDWKPACLAQLAMEADFGQLPARIEQILAGQVAGRVVVKPTGG